MFFRRLFSFLKLTMELKFMRILGGPFHSTDGSEEGQFCEFEKNQL